MTWSERTLRRTGTAPPSPAAAPISAAKRSLSKLSRKHSNGSVQSSSSTGTARSVEGVGFRQPAKSRIRRHQHRLSSVFSRAVLSPRGDITTSGEELSVTEDPSELSSHITAPGILKIFGTEICEGANYKSVLATTHSSAKELVKEALERYSLNKADAHAYVLCDVIGCLREREWRSECVRVVGDYEQPLLLQSLWKPREGYARRFEIQSRASVEEKISRDKDTVTAGINAQARKLQKTRSRGRSVVFGGGGSPADLGLSMCRSLSETDLRPSPERQQSLKSQSGGEDPEGYKELPCKAGRKEETECGDDNCTQYSIHPPVHFPYFLLLQGFSYRQDFIIYSLKSSCTVFGCNSEQSGGVKEHPDVDVTLWAPDIQPQHCCIQRLQVTSSDFQQNDRKTSLVTVLKPFHGAVVKRNGAVINQEVEIHSGDVIGLGKNYLFMFKEPSSEILGSSHSVDLSCQDDPPQPPPPLPPPKACPLYQTGTLCAAESTFPCLRDINGQKLVLFYDVEHETRVLEEIFKKISHHEDLHKLTPSFLVCLCLQQSATHFPMTDLRRLLLHIANEVQIAVLERAKEVAAKQSEMEGVEPVRLQMESLLRSLQPLVLWMANSIELLHFIHQEVPCLLHGISRMEEEEDEDCLAVLELRLSTVRPASEEAMTVLEEVIMFTFQQCVYYLTKLLYPVLPGLLDSNPFSVKGEERIPSEVASVLDIFTKTLNLIKDFHVHPEISIHLFTYLFFFVNAILFNLLMERGSGGSFYQWTCGVQIRANLDALIDWAYTAGLGELAQSQLFKLSSAVNLLATTREHLLQASWGSLRTEFFSLSPAQLHHMLTEYNPRRPCPTAWTPCGADADAAYRTDDILESFDDHPPLVLPIDGFQLNLKKPVGDTSLIKELVQLQAIIKTLNVRASTTQCAQHESAVPLEAKRTRMEILPKAHLEQGHKPLTLSKNCDSSTCSSVSGDEGTCEVQLSQRIKALDLQDKEANHNSRALEALCLLTPPNTPLSSERMPSNETKDQDTESRHHTRQSCDTDTTKHTCGECGRHEVDDDDDGDDDEVFVVELLKGPGGLGLSLVDGVETPVKMNGIYIKSVIPGSPAALSQRLRPGDQLLAINGHGLVGLDYHTGRELIQKAGDQAQLLVARAERTHEDTVPGR
ncbi:ras-associating and dilute domain-containing protein isoform X1 [Tachysurus vachellii]|uniref:ras-associating and dilute domain-containing protein isoform X1 n=1 Tax=Tachysurus vachellii TaxID=175792 RepID=UPI00296AA7A4|nr:ras-associating and dilute domain-containing protein isoform X1 [Tachysurus vachellii]